MGIPETSFIISITLNGETRAFRVNKVSLIIGRDGKDAGVDLQVPDPTISRMHLEVFFEQEAVFIKDLGSANGTYLNGLKLNPQERVLYQREMNLRVGKLDGTRIEIYEAPALVAVEQEKKPKENHASQAAVSVGAVAALYEEHKIRLDRLLVNITSAEQEFISQKNQQSQELATQQQALVLIQEQEIRLKEQLTEVKDLTRHEKAVLIQLQNEEREVIDRTEQLKVSHEELENTNSQLQNQIQKLRGDEAHLLSQIGEKRDEHLELSKKVIESLQTLERDRAAFDKEIWNRKSEVEKQESEALARLKVLQARIEELELQTVSEEVLLQSLALKKQNLEKDIAHQKQASELELVAANQLKTSLHSEAEAYKTIIQKLSDQESQRNEELCEQEKVLAEIHHKVKQIQETYEIEDHEHQKELRRKKVEIESLEAENQVKVLKLQVQLEEVQLQCSQANREMKNAEVRKQALEEELGQLRKVFENDLAATKKEAALLIAEAETAKDAEVTAKREQETLALETSRTEEKLTQIRERLAQLDAERRSAEEGVIISRAQAESQSAKFREALEAELAAYEKSQKVTLDRNFENMTKRMEADLVEARLKEMENIRELQETEKKALKAKMHFQVDEISQLTAKLITEKVSDGGKLSASDLSEYRESIGRVLAGKSEAVTTEAAANRTRRYWKKKGLQLGIPAACIAFFLLFPDLPKQLESSLARFAATQQSNSGVFLEQIKSRGLKFQPPMDRTFRPTYRENLLYLENYVGMKLSNEEQKSWTVALNNFFTGRLGLNDRVVVDFVSTESVMAQELMSIRETMVEQYKDQSLARMEEIEKRDTEKLESMLQGPENFKKFKVFEQSFYEDFLKNRVPAEAPSP